MLTNVPLGFNAIARNVIVHHPNAYNIEVYRRLVRRPDPQAGGLPTLGGMMVLTAEDEDDITWALVGLGYALPAEPFTAAPMMERRDAHNAGADELRFLIEPESPVGEPGGFLVEVADVLYLLFGVGPAAPRVAYEVTRVETAVSVPPFVLRYVVVRRDDLDLLTPGSPEED